MHTEHSFPIDPNISRAETLPTDFYTNPSYWEPSKQQIFARTWQWVGDTSLIGQPEHIYPFTLLEKMLDEPLVLTRDSEDEIRCLSNVCTHRGFILTQHPGKMKQMVCGYHGRRFALDGTMKHMPEFDGAENFPRPCDHLQSLPLGRWRQFMFVSLDPAFPWEQVVQKMEERVGFLPLEDFRFEPAWSKEYLVHAHWALYCDNYLEGFHIPFVHSALNKVLDYGSYTTECYDYCNVQIGYADEGSQCFDLPADHPDADRKVTAFYYWVFPNMMFNFYPWGLSVNVVRPLSQDRCKVSFLTYIYDQDIWEAMGAGQLMDKVEREDEFVVEGVQKGIHSRFYQTGRFSPKREKGVHHFHGLISQFMG